MKRFAVSCFVETGTARLYTAKKHVRLGRNRRVRQWTDIELIEAHRLENGPNYLLPILSSQPVRFGHIDCGVSDRRELEHSILNLTGKLRNQGRTLHCLHFEFDTLEYCAFAC